MPWNGSSSQSRRSTFASQPVGKSPALRKIDDPLPTLRHSPGTIDVCRLDLQYRANIAVIDQLPTRVGDPQREMVATRQQIEGIKLDLNTAVAQLHFRDMHAMQSCTCLRDQCSHRRIEP